MPYLSYQKFKEEHPSYFRSSFNFSGYALAKSTARSEKQPSFAGGRERLPTPTQILNKIAELYVTGPWVRTRDWHDYQSLYLALKNDADALEQSFGVRFHKSTNEPLVYAASMEIDFNHHVRLARQLQLL